MENHPIQNWKRNSSRECFVSTNFVAKFLEKAFFQSFVKKSFMKSAKSEQI